MRSSRRPSTSTAAPPLLAAALALALTACVAPAPGPPPGATLAAPACGDEDVASGDASGPVPDTSPDVAPPQPFAPELPPCDRACDRVVRCAVDACTGFSWINAGGLVEGCLAACDPATADTLEAAGDCGAVLDVARSKSPGFDAACASDACASACDHFAGCLVEACPGITDAFGAQLEIDCQKTCTPVQAAQILAVEDCQTLAGYLRADSPEFAKTCAGRVDRPVCAGMDLCGPYADKVTSCMQAHCGEPLEPWEAAVHALVLEHCLHGDDCPPASGVAQVLQPAVTCEVPPLAQVGPAPPFTALCDGSTPVTAAEMTAACEKIIACPGGDALVSAEVCAVLIAVRPDAADRAACLLDAEGCAAIYGCLEGF